MVLRGPGLYFFALRDFGNWLRLKARVSGGEPSVKGFVYPALKE